MKVRFTVTLDLKHEDLEPGDIDRQELAVYVADAIASWVGCTHPSNPIRALCGVSLLDATTGHRTLCASDYSYDPWYDG